MQAFHVNPLGHQPIPFGLSATKACSTCTLFSSLNRYLPSTVTPSTLFQFSSVLRCTVQCSSASAIREPQYSHWSCSIFSQVASKHILKFKMPFSSPRFSWNKVFFTQIFSCCTIEQHCYRSCACFAQRHPIAKHVEQHVFLCEFPTASKLYMGWIEIASNLTKIKNLTLLQSCLSFALIRQNCPSLQDSWNLPVTIIWLSEQSNCSDRAGLLPFNMHSF